MTIIAYIFGWALIGIIASIILSVLLPLFDASDGIHTYNDYYNPFDDTNMALAAAMAPAVVVALLMVCGVLLLKLFVAVIFCAFYIIVQILTLAPVRRMLRGEPWHTFGGEK